MKHILRKSSLILCCFFLFILTFALPSKAYDFETIPLSQEEQLSFWESIDLHPVEIPTRFDSVINSFDVSKDKKIVLALDNFQILVLDSSFHPIVMFEFSAYGSYYVHWEGENIVLRLVRSDSLVSFALNGDMVEIEDYAVNDINVSIGNTQTHKTSMLVDGTEYYVRKTSDPVSNFFMGYSYHQLVCRQSDGTEILLYDVSNNHSATFIWAILIIAVIGIITIFVGGLIVPRIVRKRIR